MSILAMVVLAGVAVIVALLIVRRVSRPGREKATAAKRTRKTHTFLARDGSGSPVFLDVFQEFIDAGARDRQAERKGGRHIMTGDGRRVEKIGTRKYRIAGTTEVLTSEDPEAP